MKLMKEIMGAEPLPTSSVKELVQKASQTLSQAQQREFDAFCDKYDLKVENPFNLDYMKFRSYITMLEKCRHCDGSDLSCVAKRIFVGDDGHLKSESVPCPVRNALRIIQNSNVPLKYRDKRADSYLTTPVNTDSAVRAFRAVSTKENLYIYGDVGCGKTLLSCVISNERAYRGLNTYFVTSTEMVRELRNFTDILRIESAMIKYTNCACLILDDLGTENISDWVSSSIFSVLDCRYQNGRQTIITSNFDVDALCERYVSPYDKRIKRRLAEVYNFIYIN